MPIGMFIQGENFEIKQGRKEFQLKLFLAMFFPNSRNLLM